MRRAVKVAMVVAAIGGVAAIRSVGGAEYNYPWCTSGASQEFGAVNCGFSTFEQCLATASGNGQSCGPNPHYVPPKGRVPVAKRRSQKTSR